MHYGDKLTFNPKGGGVKIGRETGVMFPSDLTSDLLGDSDTTELRIAVLHLDDYRDELLGRAFRAGLSSPA